MHIAAPAQVEDIEDTDRLITNERPRPPDNAQNETQSDKHGEHREPQPEPVTEHADYQRHDRATL